MITTKEKYKDIHIVYIDESVPTYSDQDTTSYLSDILELTTRRNRDFISRME